MDIEITKGIVKDKFNQLKAKFTKETDRLIKTLLGKVEALLVVDLSSNLKILNIEFKDKPYLSALNIIDLPKDDTKDKAIVDHIKKFIQENNIQHNNSILIPHLEASLIKHLKLPVMPKAELHEALRWQIKDELFFELSQAAIDFILLGETVKEDQTKALDCICVAAKEEEVRHQVALLKEADLVCLRVSILPFGWMSLIEKFDLAREQSLATLHLEEDKCFIILFKDNKLEFYREIPVSISKLRESLKGTLITDSGKVELSQDEIEELLFKIGIPQEAGVIFKEKLSSIQILSMLRPSLERLAAEIKRSIIYCTSQFQLGAVKKIFISGQGVQIPNLDSFLSKELSLEALRLNLRDKIKSSPSIDNELLAQSYGSFALGLSYKEGINLMPYDMRTEKLERYERFSLRWFTIVAFLILIVSYLFALAGVGFYQNRLNNAKLQLNVLSEVRNEKIRMEEFDKFISGVQKSVFPTDSLLKQLSVIVPNDILLDSLSVNSASGSGLIIGVAKTISKSPDVVLTQFVQELGKTPYFVNTSITAVEKESTGGVRFKISFKLP